MRNRFESILYVEKNRKKALIAIHFKKRVGISRIINLTIQNVTLIFRVGVSINNYKS